jgi:crotonobetainyl-CoA:carnitine CoA-transferase CaiB-like acyl-CoA transferase
MGLGYEVLRERRPGIVLLNLPGTHRHGPWSGRPTTGNAVMAASGINTLMGFPGQRPRGFGVAYPDFTSPYLLATSVMAALRLRDLTGEGREMDLSQLSATLSLLGPEWMRYRHTGVQPPPAANRHPDRCPHGVFPTRGEDEWLALEVDGDQEWQALLDAMGSAAPDDPRFATHAGRKGHEDDLDVVLAAWTKTHERFALAARLQACGVAAAPVEDLRDTFVRDPQLRHHYQRVSHPHAPGVELPVDREAIRFAGRDHVLARGPIFGEHNEPIMRELLGRSEAEYVKLVLDEVLV